jgi:hypothetical protein
LSKNKKPAELKASAGLNLFECYASSAKHPRPRRARDGGDDDEPNESQIYDIGEPQTLSKQICSTPS